jgi:hypothetical protein
VAPIGWRLSDLDLHDAVGLSSRNTVRLRLHYLLIPTFLLISASVLLLSLFLLHFVTCTETCNNLTHSHRLPFEEQRTLVARIDDNKPFGPNPFQSNQLHLQSAQVVVLDTLAPFSVPRSFRLPVSAFKHAVILCGYSEVRFWSGREGSPSPLRGT